MPDELVVLDGSTFLVSDSSGDVGPGAGPRGFFFADTRHLSTWQLLVDGEPLRVLSSRTVDYYSARIYLTPARARVGRNPVISVRRDRFVSDGIHEDLVIENHSAQAQDVRVDLTFAADFADIFEIRDSAPKMGSRRFEQGDDRVTIWYRRGPFIRGTVVAFSQSCSLSESAATFQLQLGPRQRWQTCIDISCIVEDVVHEPGHRCGSFGTPKPKMPLTLEQWVADAPQLQTRFDPLVHAYRQSLIDLAALRFRPTAELTWSLPAAGLPWFMALFGRDSLITSYQALPFQPRLAATTLEALAALQAKEMDDFRDAEPGKILHELRFGELTRLGERPHSPYYGTHDATPLFLILLDEYERWTGDAELVLRLEPAARAALTWIEKFGDLDGDGYLEYRTRSPKGLVNQYWKDSWNSVLFADGRIAEPPIATSEVQGYAYDARVRAARLARLVWRDDGLAVRLEAEAADLRRRFNADFWDQQRGHYVLALDASKRRVDAMTSNAGHLLWSGIVDEERASVTVERLMAPDMFSGWGIRTMSTNDAGYNPIEYHNGTVWPHDTGLIAEGFRRYGFREQASRLALALIDASAYFDYRLPEVFAGFPRGESGFPVEYPTASRPQAWAAGAVLLALRTLLGLDAGEGGLSVTAHLPAELSEVRLAGVPVRGRRVDARGGAGT